MKNARSKIITIGNNHINSLNKIYARTIAIIINITSLISILILYIKNDI